MEALKNRIDIIELIGGDSYVSKWQKAIDLIVEQGANFNGVVYAKKISTKNADLSVYINGEYVSLGRHFSKQVEELKALFLELASNLDIKEENIEAIETSSKKWIKGNHAHIGHFVYGSGNYGMDVLSGYYEE